MQKRDKLGKFLPIGDKPKPRKSFNQRYVKVDLLDAAFLAGFETARRVPKTFSGKGCLQAWKENK